MHAMDVTCERQFLASSIDFDVRTRRALDFQLVNNDDDCVIVQSAEHALRTSLSLRTSRIVDGRTQCMPLSAAVVNPRSAGRVEGTQSMLGLIGVRKLVCRLPRGDCGDQVTSTAVQSPPCVSDSALLRCHHTYFCK